jgi:hypothetical protein
MRKLGLFAFGVTTCVLVPAARHVLRAGPHQVAKLIAPNDSSLTVNGAKIDVTVDKGIVDPGGKVKVTLTSSARAKVDLLVYEQQGSDGGRVELPPVRVGYEEVAFAGAETKSLSLTLRGQRGEGMDGRMPFGHYTIFVLPLGSADKLEKLRHRAAKVENPMGDTTGRYNAFENAYYQLGETDNANVIAKAGEVARLDVNTRPAGSPLSIIIPDTGKAEADIVVKVRVKNPSEKPVEDVRIRLDSQPSALQGKYNGIEAEAVEIIGQQDDAAQVSLKGREIKDVVFHVKAHKTGTLGLFATARCENDGCYSDKKARLLNDNALDAMDIEAADTKAPTVAVTK